MAAKAGSFGIALAGGSSARSIYSHASILLCNLFGMAGSPYPTGTSSEALFARDARTAGPLGDSKLDSSWLKFPSLVFVFLIAQVASLQVVADAPAEFL